MTDTRRLTVAVLCVMLSASLLFVLVPSRSSPGVGEYNPWADINNDGTVDIYDAILLSNAFDTHGQNLTKASVMYDSGWINLTGQTSLNYTLTHNLNLTSADMIVDARQGSQTWNKTYGTQADWSNSMVQTGDGGYVLAGATGSSVPNTHDFWLVKTDSNGNMQWNQTYGGPDDDYAYSVVQTSDGGYVLGGATGAQIHGDYDFWLVKTDSSGKMQWNQRYGGPSYDEAWSTLQTSDGGYALTGLTQSFGAGYGDAWLVKTDSSGNIQWNQTYGGPDDDHAHSMVQTSDGGYALAGITGSFGPSNGDFWLIKTDSSGNMQWNQTYAGKGYDYARSVVQTSDGGYAIAGRTADVVINRYDFWLVKTDSSGNIQWNQRYGGPDDDDAYSVVQTSDGGYALAGTTDSFGTGLHFWLIKTDANGNTSGIVGDSGLAWIPSSMNSITLVRDAATPWGFVRVQIWKQR